MRLPLALLALVLAVDAVVAATGPPLWVLGLLDEPAHLATAGLALLAAGVRGRTALLVLAGSVAVDADHVPLYLGVPGVEAAGGRPFTHCALTVLVLAAVGLRWRPALLLAAGTSLHLLRDFSTGGGVPLLWPLDVVVQVPYPAYAAVLVVLTVLALRRTASVRGSRRGSAA